MVYAASAAFLLLLMLRSKNYALLMIKSSGLETALHLDLVLLDGWVRVPIALYLRLGRGIKHPLQLYVFGKRRALAAQKKKGKSPPAAARFVRRALHFGSVRFVRLHARIGLSGDAALTAGACGFLQALFYSAFACLRTKHPGATARASVLPSFSEEVFKLALSCMIVCPFGHIIQAAIAAGFRRGKEKKA